MVKADRNMRHAQQPLSSVKRMILDLVLKVAISQQRLAQHIRNIREWNWQYPWGVATTVI